MTVSSFHKTALRFAALALCAATLLLTGCASVIKAESIVPTQVEIANKHPGSVSVSTVGGSEPDAPSKLRISNATLTEALVTSIEKYKSFSQVVKGAGANYQLVVLVVSADHPSFGMTFTVKAEFAWALKRANGTTVWQESITSEGTATGGEAFVGAERVRLAIERATRDNIAQGLAKISNLKL